MKEIKRTISEILSKYSFTNKSNNWFFKNANLVIVINLQKSNYGNIYYLNTGIWINQIGGFLDFPKENKCHLRFRALRIIQKIHKDYKPTFFLNFEKGEKENIEILKKFLECYFCPFISEIDSVLSIKEIYSKGILSGAYITKELRDIIE